MDVCAAPKLLDLKVERARLTADDARREADEAMRSTRSAVDVAVASSAVSTMIAAKLAGLPQRLADVVGDEHEEARVHYLLSDAVNQVLSEIGASAATAASALPELGAAFRRGARPRDLLTVAQHADRTRWITSGTNAPGQWRTDRTPYLRDIMDDLSEHSPVRTVAFIKSAGVGSTEAMFNWINYVMAHLGNRDLLVVVPTIELRDRSFNPRLAKMIAENPQLSALVSRASRSSTNRQDILEYGAHARLLRAGANSADSLRSDHLPYVICDEIDAYPWDVGREGSPLDLIANRQRTFGVRAKTFLISTPTNEHESHIDAAWRRSDRRRYHVPCPHCGAYQVLVREQLMYRCETEADAASEHKTVVDAWYLCIACGAELREGDKPRLLAAGVWIPERPHVKSIRGYHLNALYSPVGLGISWREFAQKWVDAQNDTAKLRAFINTSLGEVWTEKGQGADPTQLMARVESWSPQDVLSRVRPLRLVAGVDVQKDRLEATLIAFSTGEEAWVIDHLIIEGETSSGDAWEELASALAEYGVHSALIDSGYNTSFVLDFCDRHKWARPSKGMAGSGRPLIEDERKRRQRLRAQRKRSHQIYLLGVDQGKALLYARLRLAEPGPGYIHFPAAEAFDDEYFRQLAAEELRTRVRNGRAFSEWVAVRPRNEALDCFILALAAHRLAGELKPDEAPLAAGRQGHFGKVSLAGWAR